MNPILMPYGLVQQQARSPTPTSQLIDRCIWLLVGRGGGEGMDVSRQIHLHCEHSPWRTFSQERRANPHRIRAGHTPHYAHNTLPCHATSLLLPFPAHTYSPQLPLLLPFPSVHYHFLKIRVQNFISNPH